MRGAEMGVLQSMWNAFTGRRHAIDAQQAEVSRALAVQREETRSLTAELDDKVEELRGSDARMMHFLSRMQGEASRARKVQS